MNLIWIVVSVAIFFALLHRPKHNLITSVKLPVDGLKPIDHCFVINMADRDDRWKLVNQRFAQTQTTLLPKLQRWNATDGKKLTQEYIQSITSKFCNYFCSNAMIGIWLSHYRLWKHIVDNNLDNVLVLEDDAKLVDDFDNKLRQYWGAGVPADWDVLFLGCFECEANAHGKQENINGNPNLFIPKAPAGMHAYMLTNTGARKLLDELKNVSYHIDIFLAKNVFNDPRKNIKMYAFKPYLIYQDVQSESDNQSNTHQLLTNLLQRIEPESQWPWSSVMNSQVMNIREYDIPINVWSIVLFVAAFIVSLIPSSSFRRKAFIGLTVYQAMELVLNQKNKTRTKTIYFEWFFIVLITIVNNAFLRPYVLTKLGL